MCVGMVAFTPGLASAKATHPSFKTFIFALGQAPPGLIPKSCDALVNVTDAFGFLIANGNAVTHTETNKNGGWGGETFEGTATFEETSTLSFTNTTQGSVQAAFAEATHLASGHLHLWGGGGNNAKGQAETGFTLQFHGTTSSGASITIHINSHSNVSASGKTHTHSNTSVSCS